MVSSGLRSSTMVASGGRKKKRLGGAGGLRDRGSGCLRWGDIWRPAHFCSRAQNTFAYPWNCPFRVREKHRLSGGMIMIRVLVAEDQAMVRGALSALLSREKDIEVVAEVARGDEVVKAALPTLPDVALLDLELPGSDRLAAAQALRAALPSCRVVILTTFGRSGYLRRAMESGAVGFLLKDAPATELAAALRRVVNGGRSVYPPLGLFGILQGNKPP